MQCIRYVWAAMLSVLCMTTSSSAVADGAARFANDSLNAYSWSPDIQISVFANRDSSVSGVTGYATVFLYDPVTYAFTQCVNSGFDITVTPSRATLAFVTEGVGTNCPSGQEVVVSCDVTRDSAVFHNVTTGTARIPVFDQQYVTHGTTDTYNALACEIRAFGYTTTTDQGSAGKTRSVNTN
jgi:hypothetical protein